jgi:hypothetical protein
MVTNVTVQVQMEDNCDLVELIDNKERRDLKEIYLLSWLRLVCASLSIVMDSFIDECKSPDQTP